MAKNKWSVSLDNDKHLKFAYGSQSSVTLSETGEVINSFSTQEPINAVEHLYDIPNRDDAKINAKWILQSQGDETFNFVPTSQLEIQLDELSDIDFGAAGNDAVLISDGDGTYSFRETTVSRLKDINQNTTGTEGFILTDLGTGNFEFQTPELKKMTDVDWEAQDINKLQDPLDTTGLVLTTDGVGGFNFKAPTSDFNNVTSIVWGASPDPKTTPGLVLTSIGGSLYQWMEPTATFTGLTGIDWLTNDPQTTPGVVLTSGPNPGEYSWQQPSSNIGLLTGVDWTTNDPYTFSGLHLSSYVNPDTGVQTFRWSHADFNDLYNIDFVTNDPHDVNGLVFTTNGDKTYNWQVPKVDFSPTGLNLIDWANVNPYATTGVHLTSYIDPSTGTHSFRWQYPDFNSVSNIDFVTNNPQVLPNLVLTSKGGSQYGWERTTVDFSLTGTITNIDWGSNIADDLVLTSTGTTYAWRTVPRTFADLPEINITPAQLATPNLILKTTASGVCEFVAPIETLRGLLDVVQTAGAPDPVNNAGLILTSIGLGTDTYEFQELSVDASNIAGWDDSTNNVVGGILTVTSPNTFEFVAPSLASMNDVNVSNATASNSVLMSDTLGNYTFQNINFRHLLDIDFTNEMNNNWMLSSNANGTFSFKQPLLQTNEDVDVLTNNPMSTSDLIMTSVGDGTFKFKKIDFTSVEGVTSLGGAGGVLTTDGANSYSFVQPQITLLTDITNTAVASNEVEWALVTNGDGTYSFKDITQNNFNNRFEDIDYAALTHPVTGATHDPKTTPNVTMVSDGDSSYSFIFPTLDALADVDDTTNNPKTTDNLVLTSVGDGTYNFREAKARFQYITNLDTSTNNPEVTPNLVLSSNGDGTYGFNAARTFADLPDVDSLTNNPQVTADMIMVSTGTGNATDPYYHFVPQTLTRMTDIDFTGAVNNDFVMVSDGAGGYSFKNANTLTTNRLNDLTDVDLTPDGLDDPASVMGLVLSTDGSGGYNFRNPSDWMTRLDNLYDVNTTNIEQTVGQAPRADVNFVDPNTGLGPSSTATQGLILKSNGDATYNWIFPEFRLMVDVDMTTNDPLTQSGLFLLTNGSGGFEFGSSISSALTVGDIQVGVTTSNTVDTQTLDLILDSATGETRINDNVTVTGNLAVGGNFDLTGNITIGGSSTSGGADTDTLTIAADITSNLIPDVDDTYDIGSSAKQWKDLYINGTASVDTLSVDENANITGNAVVGGIVSANVLASSANTTVGGSIIVSDNAIVNGNITVVGTASVTSTLGVSDNATIGGTLSVVNATTLQSTLDVTSHATIGGNLRFDGTINNSLIPNTTLIHSVGSAGAVWQEGHFNVINASTINVPNLTLGDIQIGVNASNEIRTSANNLVLDSATGTTEINDNVNVSGELEVTNTFKLGNWTITTNASNDILFSFGGNVLFKMDTAGVFQTGSDVII